MIRKKGESEKKKTGRPLADIDEAKVAELAAFGASDLDIAAVIGCNNSTLARRFKKTLVKARAQRRNSLRQWQTENAKGGNATMQIWLGKQELNQVDKIHTEHKHEIYTLRWTDDRDGPASHHPDAADALGTEAGVEEQGTIQDIGMREAIREDAIGHRALPANGDRSGHGMVGGT